MEALDVLGVADRAGQYPDDLSGGERQRVAIARAVVGDRHLLLADEPTGALDSVNGEAVMRLLRAACKTGVAGVVVTHDAQLASWADRVVFLRDGRVVDQTPEPDGSRRLVASETLPMSAAEPGRWGKRADDGGMPARRAVVRWAWRLFRREWRQQFLVLALLTVATAARSWAPRPPTILRLLPGDAEFGSANFLLRFRSRDSDPLDAVVDAARDHFGTIDVYTHKDVAVPGSVESVEFRDQAPDGAFSGPMLGLHEGRYPTSESEVAVTDGVAKTYNLQIGDQFNVGGSWTVVGIVENTSDLNAEFALVVPGALDAPEALTILVNANEGEVRSFQERGEYLSYGDKRKAR